MIILPEIFEEKLKLDTSHYYKGAVYTTCNKFDQIFSENDLYFFEEYTDHGIRHINSVLAASVSLITPSTNKLLTEKDISILVLSVFLHDLGMHLQPLTFKKMITGGYDDDELNAHFDDQKWPVLWSNYLFEAKKFNDQQRKNIFGDSSVEIIEPDLNNPDKLTGIQKKLIGEFIRRHHPRIAYEVAFKGLAAHDGTQIDFCSDFDNDHKFLAGILARSHGMNIRDTFPILSTYFNQAWKQPFDIHIIYLMAILRLADYIQIDKTRILKSSFLTRQFQSEVSFVEHHKHLQTTYVQKSVDDPEVLYVIAKPKNSAYFLALQSLFRDIQQEVDHSWAVLGEVYGGKPYEEQPKLAYRRIRSNIDDKKIYEATVPFVPEKISFSVDKEIPKLLVNPLYNYEPSYGVRELLQNAVDACWEREFYEKNQGNEYKSSILLKIEREIHQYILSISDNGKGMTLDEIKNYFLKVGGSFRQSSKWRHDHLDEQGHSNVNKSGRFGIGVLAAYLLGNEIEVKTKSIFSSFGYSFRTTLEREQIEIIKDCSIKEGTIISIVITPNVYELLIKNASGSFRSRAVEYNKWYVLGSPKVTFSLPDKNLRTQGYTEFMPGFKTNLSLNWHEIQNNEYNKIIWSYSNVFRSKLVCNGFIISENYRLKNNKIKPPALIVYDFDAKLPLNLSRTSVGFPLSFNDQLEEDIYRDILAKLLLMSIENPYYDSYIKYKPTLFQHPSFENRNMHSPFSISDVLLDLETIIFCKGGFLLNHLLSIKRIEGFKHLKIFDSYQRATKLELFPDFYKFSLLNIEAISLSTLSDGKYSLKSELKQLGKHFIKSRFMEIIGWSEGFNQGGVKYSEIQSKFNKNISNVVFSSDFLNVGPAFIFYKELRVNNKQNSLFESVIIDYLGDDLIIPYNIEDRKKKFPKAFKELEPYMRKYLKEK